jgi:hypothetical protein
MWVTLASTYNIDLIRWDTYIESLIGAGYTDLDVETYLGAPGDVHPNDAGHAAAYDLAITQLGSLIGSSSTLPDRVYAESEDFENDPIIRNGTDNDGETGTWADDGTARESSTADSTITWTGTFCSFALDTNYGATAGVLAWSIDGGSYTNSNLGARAGAINPVTSLARAEHTVVIKVISGTVKINRFLAV